MKAIRCQVRAGGWGYAHAYLLFVLRIQRAGQLGRGPLYTQGCLFPRRLRHGRDLMTNYFLVPPNAREKLKGGS